MSNSGVSIAQSNLGWEGLPISEYLTKNVTCQLFLDVVLALAERTGPVRRQYSLKNGIFIALRSHRDFGTWIRFAVPIEIAGSYLGAQMSLEELKSHLFPDPVRRSPLTDFLTEYMEVKINPKTDAMTLKDLAGWMGITT